jgi:hypothetical protein
MRPRAKIRHEDRPPPRRRGVWCDVTQARPPLMRPRVRRLVLAEEIFWPEILSPLKGIDSVPPECYNGLVQEMHEVTCPTCQRSSRKTPSQG